MLRNWVRVITNVLYSGTSHLISRKFSLDSNLLVDGTTAVDNRGTGTYRDLGTVPNNF